MTTRHGKPRIAIPIPTSGNENYNRRSWPEFAAAVEAVGGEPVRIPLGLEPSETARLVSSAAAVLLPGSPSDVHPQKYGQATHPATASPDLTREATDELLLQDAFHLRKPLLGVCFGMQMMNVWCGGTLIQHLATAQRHRPEPEEILTHTIAVLPEAPLLRSFFLGEDQPTINSSHHQAVDRIGDGLLPAAHAPDGTVEAVEGASPEHHFVLGVQWHPERSYQKDEASLQIFTALVAAAHRWHLPQA